MTDWNPVWEDIRSKDFAHKYFNGIYYIKSGEEKKLYQKRKGIMRNEFTKAINQSLNDSAFIEIENLLKKKQDKYLNAEERIYKKIGGINEYKSLSNEQKMSFWTNAFFFNNNAKSLNLNSPKDCFRIFLGSKDFIEEFKDKGVKYSRLSSEQMAKAYGIESGKLQAREKFKRDIGRQRITKNNDLYNDIMKGFAKALNGGMTKEIEKQIKIAMHSAAKKNKIDDITPSQQQYYEPYENIKKALKENLEEVAKRQGISGTITIGHNQQPYLTISTEEITSGAYFYWAGDYSKRKEIGSNESTIKFKREYVYKAIQDVYSLLGENKRLKKLNLVQLGIFDVSDEYWQKVKNYINNPNGLRNLLNKISDRFFNQDWNTSTLTGMIGELTAYLSTNSQLKNKELIGTSYDKIQIGGKEINLGESYKDLSFKNYQNWGINIKHYISNTGGEFILYSPKKSGIDSGVSIASDYMYKYFTPNQVKLIQFIEANRSFFIEQLLQEQKNNIDNKINQTIYYYSLLNITNFVRLTSTTGEEDNLFYIINNIYIPSSVIINYIIKNIESLNLKEKLFKIDGNTLLNDYGTYNYKESEMLNETLKEKLPANLAGKGRTKIIFNGLKLENLKNLIL